MDFVCICKDLVCICNDFVFISIDLYIFPKMCYVFLWILCVCVRVCTGGWLQCFLRGFCSYIDGFRVRMSKASGVDLRAWDQSQSSRRGSSRSTSHGTGQCPLKSFLYRSISNANSPKFQTSPFETHENPFWISQIMCCNVSACCEGEGQNNRRGSSFCLYHRVETKS